MRRLFVLGIHVCSFLGFIVMIAAGFGLQATYHQMTQPKPFAMDPGVAKLKYIHELIRKEEYTSAFEAWHILETEPGEKSACSSILIAEAFAKHGYTFYAQSIFETLVEKERVKPDHCSMYAQWLLRWGDGERALDMMLHVHKKADEVKLIDYYFLVSALDVTGHRKEAIAKAEEGLSAFIKKDETDVKKLKQYKEQLEHRLRL